MNNNLNAFLETLKWSELGEALIVASNRGYNVLVGSTPQHLLLFSDYSKHPNILNEKYNSTAAGAYQIIHPTYVGLCEHSGYSDFEPETQDLMARDLIAGREALDDVLAGRFETAIAKCNAEWASLPGGNSGQRQNSLNDLTVIYQAHGGTFAEVSA